ncbi:1-acyl-sn-glycerol-3-phosphate acyltransferase [Aquabacterium sp. A7-Y]|uniref:lysophospholipid acyltransferase family protein n=1 Tax=Aquabacterium sp. A7-Y TaxID=1349605 RepID=UPI00223DF473|nr:lysophospholipid acyltransferase family protein [Aquabacterium sp. A7-Y]MCW7537430.1 1-acyl-sn-glycerol-3-phosphate acyltransferase [Aquabacterium sp. A7-Y]
MKSAVLAAWRLCRVVLHVLRGLAIVLLLFGGLDAAGRRGHVLRWSQRLLALAGVGLRVDGQPHPGAKLYVANHVSWLDIVAINAVSPARFVSKSEVKRWPLLNRLVDAADTLYIERERRRDALRVVHQVAEALQAGDTVAVFPEGTTSDGRHVLPFHANLLQAAIATATPVQPVALRYSDAGHAVSPAAAYVGDTNLVSSLWQVLTAEGLVVRVRLLPAEGTAGAERRVLSEQVREKIAAGLLP